MRFFQNLISVFFCLTATCSHVIAQTPTPCDTTNVFQVVETMPQFHGGDSALMEYLRNNIQFPSTEMDCGIASSIYLTFIIDTTGKTTCVEILRPEPESCILQNGFGDSLIDMIYNMPLWIPGKQNGQKVKVKYNLPIRIDFAH